MLILDHSEIAHVDASPEQVFAIVSDPTRHAQLAGSGEVLAVRMVSEGPVQVGSKFEADEDIKMGPGRTRFVAVSTVVELDPPRLFSWTSTPPGRPQPKRIQWWFRLEPDSTGTLVTHQVQVDMGPVGNVLLAPIYPAMRGRTIKAGMAHTLENLATAAVGSDHHG